MGFLDIFRQKQQQIKDVEPENELRRQSRELQQLKRNLDIEIMVKESKLKSMELDAEISELEQELNGGEEEQNTADSMIGSILSKVMQNNAGAQNTPANITQSTNSSSGVTFSDDELKGIWNNLPTWQKSIAKTMSDENIKEFIKQKNPQVNAETLERAIKIIKA